SLGSGCRRASGWAASLRHRSPRLRSSSIRATDARLVTVFPPVIRHSESLEKTAEKRALSHRPDERLVSRFDLLSEPDPDVVVTPPVYVAFDVLYAGQQDYRGQPLTARREALEGLVDGAEG